MSEQKFNEKNTCVMFGHTIYRISATQNSNQCK